MKKGLLTSYVSGITDMEHGEGYVSILRYFFPEFISALLLYSLPFWIDSFFISQLESTSMYATLGSTNTFIFLVIKLAESLSIGTVIMSGQFNGMHAYRKAGSALRDTFWVTCIVGFCCFLFLYTSAYYIYAWYGVSEEMIHLGVPFLRLRAIGLFFTFLYMAFVGFLRGVKNTKAPMVIFMAIRYWNAPTSIIPRTRVRSIVALALGGLQTIGWSVFIYSVAVH